MVKDKNKLTKQICKRVIKSNQKIKMNKHIVKKHKIKIINSFHKKKH